MAPKNQTSTKGDEAHYGEQSWPTNVTACIPMIVSLLMTNFS